jgi:hypothetical protein
VEERVVTKICSIDFTLRYVVGQRCIHCRLFPGEDSRPAFSMRRAPRPRSPSKSESGNHSSAIHWCSSGWRCFEPDDEECWDVSNVGGVEDALRV